MHLVWGFTPLHLPRYVPIGDGMAANGRISVKLPTPGSGQARVGDVTGGSGRADARRGQPSGAESVGQCSRGSTPGSAPEAVVPRRSLGSPDQAKDLGGSMRRSISENALAQPVRLVVPKPLAAKASGQPDFESQPAQPSASDPAASSQKRPRDLDPGLGPYEAPPQKGGPQDPDRPDPGLGLYEAPQQKGGPQGPDTVTRPDPRLGLHGAPQQTQDKDALTRPDPGLGLYDPSAVSELPAGVGLYEAPPQQTGAPDGLARPESSDLPSPNWKQQEPPAAQLAWWEKPQKKAPAPSPEPAPPEKAGPLPSPEPAPPEPEAELKKQKRVPSLASVPQPGEGSLASARTEGGSSTSSHQVRGAARRPQRPASLDPGPHGQAGVNAANRATSEPPKLGSRLPRLIHEIERHLQSSEEPEDAEGWAKETMQLQDFAEEIRILIERQERQVAKTGQGHRRHDVVVQGDKDLRWAKQQLRNCEREHARLLELFGEGEERRQELRLEELQKLEDEIEKEQKYLKQLQVESKRRERSVARAAQDLGGGELGVLGQNGNDRALKEIEKYTEEIAVWKMKNSSLVKQVQQSQAARNKAIEGKQALLQRMQQMEKHIASEDVQALLAERKLKEQRLIEAELQLRDELASLQKLRSDQARQHERALKDQTRTLNDLRSRANALEVRLAKLLKEKVDLEKDIKHLVGPRISLPKFDAGSEAHSVSDVSPRFGW